MNKGKEFEAFVALIERAVNTLPGVEVLHDVKNASEIWRGKTNRYFD